MRRICCFCETWASGGIESFLTKLFAGIDRDELEIDLVVAQRIESVFDETLQHSGVRIIQLSGSKSRYFANYFKLKKILKENRYDAFHLNAFQGLQLVYLRAAKSAGVPVRIAHSHGSALRRSRGVWVKLALHKLGKALFSAAATHNLACSQAAAEFMFPKETETQIIPNGIDTAKFRFDPREREQIRSELGLEGKFVVGCVGRLEESKNISFMIDVLEKLLQIRPESLLLLVGEGAEKDALLDKAREKGIEDKVVFYGVSDCVEKLLWAMDAFAFPSLMEGLGLVAVEAQAAGLTAVCSEHIPQEAELTPRFRRIALKCGAQEWAQALLQTENGLREEGASEVLTAGFDITNTVEMVRKCYLNL